MNASKSLNVRREHNRNTSSDLVGRYMRMHRQMQNRVAASQEQVDNLLTLKVEKELEDAWH